tara:strand:- start:1563 stop:2492 length:930 start_codon:yes stop_codon:yes gene_type:complete
MEKVSYNSSVGVIIARLQTPFLHDGHKGLIEHVINEHDNVLVFLGVSKIQNTKKNPLDFITRAKMVQAMYPNVIVLPMEDNRSDEKWSKNIDNTIRTIFPEKIAIIYGSRDSFIPHYHGKQEIQEYPPVGEYNATELRKIASEKTLCSEDFRAGVIYGINKQRPTTYSTVDVVVFNEDKKILLARKPTEKLFRFVGGFVDRTDYCYETAARRELYEETKLSALKMHYICSQQIEDWRYAKEDSGIMTTLFMAYEWDQMGKPEASDDIEEVKYFEASMFIDINVIKENIVPEHVDLMITFMTYLNNKKLL